MAQRTKQLSLFFGVSSQILIIVFLGRFIVDSGTRMIYPFIPQLSTGLGLTVVGFSWLIFARSITGLVGPIFGVLADKYGRRKIMTLGLLSQGVGVAGVAFSWQWQAIGPMLLFGLSVSTFMPAEQAYISDQTSYQKRGRALGSIELAWATAGMISLPIIGWMIDRFGWQSPFMLLTGLSFLGATLIWFLLPPVEQRSSTSISWSQIGSISLRPNVLASMGVGMLLFVAVSCFITVWGIWLSTDFGLTATTLGLVATVIGIAELGGSGLSTLFIDKIGKRRGSQAGLIITALIFFLLPLTQISLIAAIIGLISVGIIIEFSIVSLISLYSEQAPEARGTVFALVALGVSIGIALGSPITTTLWEKSGLVAVCVLAGICLLMACGLVYRFLKD